MSRKKKGLALWLALFLGVSSLTGCGSGNDNMTQLSQKGADIMNSSDEEQDTDVELLKTKTQLPEDGIITQAQMETIAGKDEKFYFVGKTDSGIGYKWTYNGSQIQNPVEQKLLVQCTEDGTEGACHSHFLHREEGLGCQCARQEQGTEVYPEGCQLEAGG